MSHTFSFICKECAPNQRFTIEREASDVKEVGNVFCPGCGQKWGSGAKIEWQDLAQFPVKATRSHDMVGRENNDQSRAAQEEAMRDRQYLDRTDPEVQPGIRKSQVETINQRMSDFVQGL